MAETARSKARPEEASTEQGAPVASAIAATVAVSVVVSSIPVAGRVSGVRHGGVAVGRIVAAVVARAAAAAAAGLIIRLDDDRSRRVATAAEGRGRGGPEGKAEEAERRNAADDAHEHGCFSVKHAVAITWQRAPRYGCATSICFLP